MKKLYWRRLAAAFVLPLALAGCPADPAPGAVGPGGTAAGASGEPLALQLLSEHDAATWSDLAIAPDGALHVIFQDTPKADVGAVYHRASRDQGATWSAPRRLSLREHHAGLPRIAIDGAGRVYAIWKDMSAHEGGWLAAGTGDHLTGAPYGRPLVATVLVGDRWSEPFRVSPSAQVVSWFPAVDPQGELHLVWSEAIKAPNGYQATEAALVMQRGLDGQVPGAAREVYRGEPDVPAGYDGSAWYYESIGGLRGYVDAAGLPHFAASRKLGKADRTDIVIWDGRAFKPQLGLDAYQAGIYYNPPELVRDDQGREHLLVQDGKGERKALLDLVVGEAEPVPVRQALEATGEVKTFQVVQGPAGQLAALIALKDRNDAETEIDLFATRYERGAWTPAVNVTTNALREGFKAFGSQADGTQVSTSYEPSFTAGAFDAAGRLNLALVNKELVSISTTRSGTYLGDPVSATDGGLVAFPKVFFVRL